MAGGKPVVLPLRPPTVAPGTPLKASDWKLDEVGGTWMLSSAWWRGFFPHVFLCPCRTSCARPFRPRQRRFSSTRRTTRPARCVAAVAASVGQRLASDPLFFFFFSLPSRHPFPLSGHEHHTHQVFSREELTLIGELAIEFDTLILSDEVRGKGRTRARAPAVRVLAHPGLTVLASPPMPCPGLRKNHLRRRGACAHGLPARPVGADDCPRLGRQGVQHHRLEARCAAGRGGPGCAALGFPH